MKFIFFTLILICAYHSALAKDFGTNGHIYKIIEEPFLKMIDERVKKVDWDTQKSKMEKIAKEKAKTPPPVAGITPAKETKIFYFDPTYELDEDVVLPCGKILHKAGTKVNPLEQMELATMKFDRRIIFIDSREEAQVKWLKEKLKEEKPDESFKNIVLLTGGSPMAMEEELEGEIEETIYFDQGGALTSKFGISHTPAVVEAEGIKLKILELYLEKER